MNYKVIGYKKINKKFSSIAVYISVKKIISFPIATMK